MAETGTSDAKKRKPNWSKDECLQLTELVKQRKTLIEGKFGPGLTSAHRQEAWQSITDSLNAGGSVKRTKEEIEKKWKNMKSSGKKSYSTFHRATTTTGGGLPPIPLSPVTDNVIDIIGRENEILTGINQTMDSTMLQILNMQPAKQGIPPLASECSLPPSLWCSSNDVADACKVTEHCRRTVWKPVRGQAPLVNFTLYYESLCPDCRNFITTQLFPAFNAVGSIVNLTLVPYGNAEEKKVGDKWVFQCQHGEEECAENLLDTCLLNIVNNINKAFPFIHCMEAGPERSRAAFRECAKKFPTIPTSQIEACANSSQGNQWEHEMAMKTDALNPQHQYVPWVTLNGVHNEKIQNEATTNLIKLLCDTYTGTKPSGCQQRQATYCARK